MLHPPKTDPPDDARERGARADIRLPDEELWRWLQERSRLEGRPMSAITVAALRIYRTRVETGVAALPPALEVWGRR